MLPISKNIFDKIILKQCKRDICKCYNKFQYKQNLSLTDTKVYRECFSCDLIQSTLRKNIMDVKKERDYPPLL